MAIEWPAELPQSVLRQGYDERPAATVLRTRMDAGPAKQRRRYTAGVRPISCQIRLRPDQVDVLDTFVTDTLGGGALSFVMPHPRTRAPVTVRLVPGDGDPGVSWAAIPDSTAFLATLKLEILP